MGQILPPPSVKLIVGLLWSRPAAFDEAKVRLSRVFGPMDSQSDVWDFGYTDYYEKELDGKAKRAFLAFEGLITAADLIATKIETNAMERELSVNNHRTVNIDPGYVDLSKLVLATTKDGNYRVYLNHGIFGQSMLYYEKGSYRPWAWTYADYREEQAIRFFNLVRAQWIAQTRSLA